jgi:hypothetical protein
LAFVYLQTTLRLNEKLADKLITNIEVLRIAFPGTAVPSIADPEDIKSRVSMSETPSFTPMALGEGIGSTDYNRVPLTKESLDLMDTPVPSGVLAEEFAYHGLAPSFLKEMHQARELLEEIYCEVKKYAPR